MILSVSNRDRLTKNIRAKKSFLYIKEVKLCSWRESDRETARAGDKSMRLMGQHECSHPLRISVCSGNAPSGRCGKTSVLGIYAN